jgi:hypothetical protein
MGKADLFPWAALFAFFEGGQDGRVQPSLQKTARALPRKKLSLS